MDVTFTSLEALIFKATQEFLPVPDPATLEAFYTVMKDSHEGTALAAKALAARIHSGNAKEALLALMATDRCMRRGDPVFHIEIGKFRFLNELIKLVSPKYYATRTPPEVQQRILQLIHAWSIEYPKENKFKVAYDMLRSQGVAQETPPPLPPEYGSPELPPPRPRTATFEDDEKAKLLQKLLQSKNPHDLQYANKLIKTLVREEERRTEEAGRRVLEIQQGVESARLLRSLLDEAGNAGEEERQLMRELEAACRRHHSTLQHLAARTDRDDDALGEIVQASEELTDVFVKYDATMYRQPRGTCQPSRDRNGADSLLDLAGLRSAGATPAAHSSSDDLQLLTDIFSTDNEPTISEPLKPVNLITDVNSNGEDKGGDDKLVETGLAALDSLGLDLLQKSLPGGRIGETFAGKQTKKIPMNALERISPPTKTASHSADTLDLDFLLNKSKGFVLRDTNTPSNQPCADDLILDISQESRTNIHNASKELSSKSENSRVGIEKAEKEIEKKDEKALQTEARGLTDVDICLSSVEASGVPPVTLLDEAGGLHVTLHLATNRPREDVHVFVLSTTSRHRSAVSDYKFHAVVPKCCRVRLLPPSGSCLPPHSAFLAPPAILQLLLLSTPRPRPAPPHLKFVLTYTCGDDTLTEME